MPTSPCLLNRRGILRESYGSFTELHISSHDLAGCAEKEMEWNWSALINGHHVQGFISICIVQFSILHTLPRE